MLRNLNGPEIALLLEFLHQEAQEVLWKEMP